MAKEQWGSRWGLIMVALGAAVGTGNIWRFPKEVAANGGGSFLIPYVLFLFSWSVPLLIMEFALGKRARAGTIGTLTRFGGKRFAWMGAWMVAVSTLINFYYAVVMGWVFRYATYAASGEFFGGTDTQALWDGFITNPYQVVGFQILGLLVGGYVVYRGTNGIERVNKVLIPMLVVLMGIAAVWAVIQPGALSGLRFMFDPTQKEVGGTLYIFKGETWIRALAQSAWSCSAGMGMAITYAVYMSRKEDTTLNAFITGLGDTSVSLIAGVLVLCTVFSMTGTHAEAMAVMDEGATGLAFIHLTRMFGAMPGGGLMAIFFFVGMLFAALTSLISGFEIATRNLMDYGWSRHKALLVVCGSTFLLGLPSALIVSGNTPVFLDNQDIVWGIGLTISGLFVAFAVWRYGVRRFREELVNTEWSDLRLGRWFDYVVVVLFPVQFVLLTGWFLYELFMDDRFTFWTLAAQWGGLLVILLLLNGWLARRLRSGPPADEGPPEALVEAELVAEAPRAAENPA